MNGEGEPTARGEVTSWLAGRQRLDLWIVSEVGAAGLGVAGWWLHEGRHGEGRAGPPPRPLPAAAALHGSLQDAIKRGQLVQAPGSPLHMRDVLLTARDVAAALAHMHSHGVVHGTLDTSSVMLASARGANPRPFTAKVRRGAARFVCGGVGGGVGGWWWWWWGGGGGGGGGGQDAGWPRRRRCLAAGAAAPITNRPPTQPPAGVHGASLLVPATRVWQLLAVVCRAGARGPRKCARGASPHAQQRRVCIWRAAVGDGGGPAGVGGPEAASDAARAHGAARHAAAAAGLPRRAAGACRAWPA